jgi:hypothetical protein
MTTTVFAEIRFWLLIASSVVVPFAIYGLLLRARRISRASVAFFGFLLVSMSGLDFYLLQSLAASARKTESLDDDYLFVSEVSIALYVLPVMFAGIGVNVVSQVLLAHLAEAEKRFDEEQPVEIDQD